MRRELNEQRDEFELWWTFQDQHVVAVDVRLNGTIVLEKVRERGTRSNTIERLAAHYGPDLVAQARELLASMSEQKMALLCTVSRCSVGFNEGAPETALQASLELPPAEWPRALRDLEEMQGDCLVWSDHRPRLVWLLKPMGAGALKRSGKHGLRPTWRVEEGRDVIEWRTK